MWNLYENLIKPEAFARIFCADLDLPSVPWVDTVTNQIRAQLEDHEGVASLDLGVGEASMEVDEEGTGEEVPECRVILSVSASCAHFNFQDSPLSTRLMYK